MSRLSPLVRAARAAANPVARGAVIPRTAARQLPSWHLSPSTSFSRAASSAAAMSSGSTPNLPPIPSSPKILVTPPDLQKIKDEGFFDDDVALVAPNDAKLVITPEAIRQLALLASREPPESPLALRVGVDSGGCHGYQYTMDLTEERGVDD